MLEQLRRQSGSFIIWLIFGIIIAAFVLFFGPQSSGDLGCGASDDFIVQIEDTPIEMNSWRFAMNSMRAGTPMAQRQTAALDALVGRTLLANAAKRAGLDVSEDEVVENLKQGIVFILGIKVPREVLFDGGAFNFDNLEYLARQRGLPGIDALIAEQKSEILAHLMRTLLVQAQVSKEEAERRYIEQNTTVTAKYVKFDVNKYQLAMAPTPADLERYLADHEAEVKELYESRKATYKDVKPQVRVRHIMINKPKDEGNVAAAKEIIAELKTKLDGGADFAKLARTSSEDARTKSAGGDLGWRPLDSIGFGPELTEAAKTLADNKVSDVIETKQGWHLIRIEKRRQGELGYDDVKLELAEPKAKRFFAKEAAKRDAEQALAKVRAGSTLEELFPKPEPKNDEAEGDKTGAVWRSSETVLASWGPSLAGQAAGAGAGEAAKTAAPPAAEPPVPVELPAYEVEPPTVQSLGPTPRRGDMLPGLGRAPELAAALFGELQPQAAPDRVFEVDSGFVLVSVSELTNADLDKFEGEQIMVGDDFEKCSMPLQLVAVTRTNESVPAECMALKKGIDNLQSFLFEECSKAAGAGKIRVNGEFLKLESGEFKYAPCGTLDFQSALVQVLSLSSGS